MVAQVDDAQIFVRVHDFISNILSPELVVVHVYSSL